MEQGKQALCSHKGRDQGQEKQGLSGRGCGTEEGRGEGRLGPHRCVRRQQTQKAQGLRGISAHQLLNPKVGTPSQAPTPSCIQFTQVQPSGPLEWGTKSTPLSVPARLWPTHVPLPGCRCCGYDPRPRGTGSLGRAARSPAWLLLGARRRRVLSPWWLEEAAVSTALRTKRGAPLPAIVQSRPGGGGWIGDTPQNLSHSQAGPLSFEYSVETLPLGQGPPRGLETQHKTGAAGLRTNSLRIPPWANSLCWDSASCCILC